MRFRTAITAAALVIAPAVTLAAQPLFRQRRRPVCSGQKRDPHDSDRSRTGEGQHVELA